MQKCKKYRVRHKEPIGKDEKKYEATIKNAVNFQGQKFSIYWSLKTQFTKSYKFLDSANTSYAYLGLLDYMGNGEKLVIIFGNHTADISTPKNIFP